MTPSPDAVAAMPDDVAGSTGRSALQFDGTVLAVAFAEPPSDATTSTRLASRVGHRINPGAGRSQS